MGKRGPKKLPTPILKMRGSWRANERAGEPEASGVPECPDWLDEEERAEWDKLCPLLQEMGVLAEADTNSLATYCVMMVQFKLTRKMLKLTGYTAPTQRGETINPIVNVQHKALEKLNKLAADFGLSPSARAGLNITPEKKKQPGRPSLSDFRKGRPA